MIQEQDLDTMPEAVEFIKQVQDVCAKMMQFPKTPKKLKMKSWFAALILPSLDKADEEILPHHIGIPVEVDDEIDDNYKFIY